MQWVLESIVLSSSRGDSSSSIGDYTGWVVGWLQLGVIAAAGLCLAAVLGGAPRQEGTAARWHAGLLVAAAELQPPAGLAIADCIEITSRFARGFAVLQRSRVSAVRLIEAAPGSAHVVSSATEDAVPDSTASTRTSTPSPTRD